MKYIIESLQHSRGFVYRFLYLLQGVTNERTQKKVDSLKEFRVTIKVKIKKTTNENQIKHRTIFPIPLGLRGKYNSKIII